MKALDAYYLETIIQRKKQ